MVKQEIRKKKRGEDWIYLDGEGEEIFTYKEDVDWVAQVALEPLRNFLTMTIDSDNTEAVLHIAEALLERAEKKIYEATNYLNKNYGVVEMVRAQHRQKNVEPEIILDVVFTPAGNGKK